MEKKVKISLWVTIVSGVILLLGIILGWVVLPIVIKKMLEKESRLENGTLVYENWKDIPLPINIKAYFFNVTNVEDFKNGNWSAVPVLQEVGPYVYSEKRVKYDIVPNPENDTIFYKQNITYFFERELSVGPDTDVINILNAPLIAVATIIYTLPEEYLPITHKQIMELLMGPLSKDDFTKEAVPVRDLMFGVRLNFVYDVALYLIERILKITYPPELQDGKFGPFVNKNGTNADGLWEVYSGIKDNTKINSLKSINGKEDLGGIWGSDECNKLKGGDGIFFAPFVKKTDRLWSYATEICRSAWLGYEKETEYRGIKTYRFRLKREGFANPEEFPENECYCVKPREPLSPTCPPTGVQRLRSCKTGAPVVISKPHFLDSDEKATQGIEGMKPDREKHDTYLDIEPTLGVPLKGIRRLQVNVEMQPFDTMGERFKKIPRYFFPYMWVEEGAELDETLYNKLKSMYVTPLLIATIGKWLAVGLGIAGTIGGGISLAYFLWWKKRNSWTKEKQ